MRAYLILGDARDYDRHVGRTDEMTIEVSEGAHQCEARPAARGFGPLRPDELRLSAICSCLAQAIIGPSPRVKIRRTSPAWADLLDHRAAAQA